MVSAGDMSAGLGKIKGAAFREFLLWWERTSGVDSLTDAMAALPADKHEFLDASRPGLGVLPSVWYDADVVHALCDAVISGRSPEQIRRIAVDGADAVMNATLRGIYRAAFRLLASPDRYPKYVQKIWNLHYDSGVVEMTETAPGEHTNHFSDWRGHHELICQLNMASGLPIYRAMGCERVTYERVACISEGAPRCTSIVRYR